MVYTVKEFYQDYGSDLALQIVAGHKGMKRAIRKPEAHRPGLSLSGYVKNHAYKRILVLGKVEIEYLRALDSDVREERLKGILSPQTPAVIVTRRFIPPKELCRLCRKREIPLFRTNMKTMGLLGRLTLILNEEFSPTMTTHGTLVEVFGVGLLIKGDSSVGKSEAALGLIERGHRLISDDIVKVRQKEGSYVEGFGAKLTHHHMEIRGIGIINVANLYGAVCVREYKSIDIVVKLETWDDHHFYDRVGLLENFTEVLGIKIPYHILPVKPGRDVVLLLETIALNHRLKGMGYNSAKEFNAKLLEVIATKNQQRMKLSEALKKSNS